MLSLTSAKVVNFNHKCGEKPEYDIRTYLLALGTKRRKRVCVCVCVRLLLLLYSIYTYSTHTYYFQKLCCCFSFLSIYEVSRVTFQPKIENTDAFHLPRYLAFLSLKYLKGRSALHANRSLYPSCLGRRRCV